MEITGHSLWNPSSIGDIPFNKNILKQKKPHLRLYLYNKTNDINLIFFQYKNKTSNNLLNIYNVRL